MLHLGAILAPPAMRLTKSQKQQNNFQGNNNLAVAVFTTTIKLIVVVLIPNPILGDVLPRFYQTKQFADSGVRYFCQFFLFPGHVWIIPYSAPGFNQNKVVHAKRNPRPETRPGEPFATKKLGFFCHLLGKEG